MWAKRLTCFPFIIIIILFIFLLLFSRFAPFVIVVRSFFFLLLPLLAILFSAVMPICTLLATRSIHFIHGIHKQFTICAVLYVQLRDIFSFTLFFILFFPCSSLSFSFSLSIFSCEWLQFDELRTYEQARKWKFIVWRRRIIIYYWHSVRLNARI